MRQYPEYPGQGFAPLRPGAEGYLPTDQEPARTAFLQAAAPIREWIYRDAAIQTVKLEKLYMAIGFYLGDPELDGVTAKRLSTSRHPRLLKLFRRGAGFTADEYIHRRQMEVAARMIMLCDLPLADIAEVLGYAGEAALADAVERWCGARPATVREYWQERGVDVVLSQRQKNGETANNSPQMLADRALERMGWKPN